MWRRREGRGRRRSVSHCCDGWGAGFPHLPRLSRRPRTSRAACPASKEGSCWIRSALDRSDCFAVRSVVGRTTCSRSRTPASFHAARRRRHVLPDLKPNSGYSWWIVLPGRRDGRLIRAGGSPLVGGIPLGGRDSFGGAPLNHPTRHRYSSRAARSSGRECRFARVTAMSSVSGRRFRASVNGSLCA